MKYKKLLSEGKIGTLTLKNRVVMTGMEIGTAEIGAVSGSRNLEYFRERAEGGVGLIISGTCRVNKKNGYESPGQLALTDEYQIEPMKRFVEEIHKYGTKFFVQLHHPGRQTSNLISWGWPLIEKFGHSEEYWDKIHSKMGASGTDALEKPAMKFVTSKLLPAVVAPSAIPCGLNGAGIHDCKTRALSNKEVKELVKDFVQAAVRAKRAGVDGVEIHAGHGYLIEEFLSSYTNRRTDEYGGSFENRMRFITEIITGIREECGRDYPMIVRLGVEEFYEELGIDSGIRLGEGVKIAKRLEELGVDGIDVTCGTYENGNYSIETTSFQAGWRSYMIRAVKQAVGIPVIAVNMTRTGEDGEKWLDEGLMDFVGIGRPLLADPEWVKKISEGREADIQRCVACVWCMETVAEKQMSGEAAECALNPRCGREYLYAKQPRGYGQGRVVVVAGGGPAGLTAAKTLGLCGFKPIVLEKNRYPGGQFYLAAVPPYKERLLWAIEDLETAALKAGAEIRLGIEATPELIAEMKPYAVFDATGANALWPGLPGAEKENVCTTTEILNGTQTCTGKTVAVVGSGMTGLETAEYLAAEGNQVYVVEMLDKIGPGAHNKHLNDILPKLDALGVQRYAGKKLVQINNKDIIVEDVKAKSKSVMPADFVVLALGVRATGFAEKLNGVCDKVIKVGDAAQLGRLRNACHTAYHAAIELR